MATEDPLQATRLDARIDRHRAELIAFLARRAPEDAEDLAQEVWIRVSRAAPSCPDEASFRAYLFTVARRLLIDHYRKRGRTARLVPIDGGQRDGAASLDVPEGPGNDPDDAYRAGEVLRVVETTLRAMKPEIAEVFRMRMTEDVSFQEVAARQNTGLNTALGRMHRATHRIADALIAAGLLARSPLSEDT